MSQYGAPPPGPDDGRQPEQQPDQQPNQPPDRQPGYNPYPDNWGSTPTGNPSFTASPPPATNPYGEPVPYGQAATYPPPADPASGPPTNPYAGPHASRPTFSFGGYAGWFTRVGAALIDGVLGALVGIPSTIGLVLLFSDTTTTTNPDGTSQVHFHHTGFPIALMIIGWLVSLGFGIWNVYIRQGRTGATIGKSVLAIRLVNSDLQPIGPGWAFVRQLLHIVDSLPCGLGYLNPIWDSRKQTFADKIMNTFVIQATTPAPRPF
jgi:uncharacterized RDD family membrane protein YckC